MTPTPQSAPLLIILFPEEVCSPADRIWGEQDAKIFRKRLGDVIHNWQYSTWVITGSNVKDLDQAGMFGVYVDSARTKANTFHHRNMFSNSRSDRVGSIEEIIYGLKKSIRAFRLAKSTPITIVGAWYSKVRSAPINLLRSALEQLGYTVDLGPVLVNPYDEDTEDREPVFDHGELVENVEEKHDLMILVHPGSCCGSADFNNGRQDAEGSRAMIAHDLMSHTGPLLIVDGSGSDELPRYSILNNAIEGALKRNEEAGFFTKRVFACDDMTPNWASVVGRLVQKLKLQPGSRVWLTGAWYFEDDSAGCVNAVYDQMSALGLRPDILDSVVRDSDGDLDWDDEDEDED